MHNVKDEPDIRIQKDRIFRRLKDHNWHTKHELEDCSGSERVASRICELRQEGNDILGKYHRKRVYMYRLKGEK